MEAEKTFDAQIKAGLKDLEAPFDPKSWDALEQRLDHADMDSGEAMDALLASRLGSMEVAGQPDDWDAMLQMIEADEAAELIGQEAAIDNAAYDKLGHLSAPYRSAHWELMAKRLEEEFSLRHQLYRYKVAEISLMLLLLLTIIRFLPYASYLYQQKGNEQPPVEFETVPVPAQQPAPTAEDLEKPQAFLQKDKAAAGTAISTVSTRTSLPAPGNHRRSKGNVTIPDKKAGGNSPATGLPANRITGPDVGPSEISMKPLSEIASETPALTWPEKLGEAGLSPGNVLLAESGIMGKADFLDLLDAQMVDTKSSKDFPILKAIPVDKQKQVRFSLFASADLNYVFTPAAKLDVFDTLVRVDNDTSFALGYGGGILASFKSNRWELQTGGVYSFRRYAPNTPKFTIQTVGYYISEDFKGIQQDLLQVPLNLQYHFKNTGNWRFYGLAGASGYFITNVVYEIAFKREPAFSSMAPPDETRTIRDEKEFPKGLFAGGSLNDNFYLTANLGLGVERFISSRCSLFFQPNYHHYFLSEGVGTNSDKFYTLSFYLGTKVSLK